MTTIPRAEERGMDLELKDKVVVITGSSKGIGLGIARAFAGEGAHVVLAARTKSEVEKAAANIEEEYGVNATAVSADVATAAGCEAVIAAAEAAGGADFFISNAGTGTDETVANAPDENGSTFGICTSWRRCAFREHSRCRWKRRVEAQ